MERSDRIKFMTAQIMGSGQYGGEDAVTDAFFIDAEVDRRIKEENLRPSGEQQ